MISSRPSRRLLPILPHTPTVSPLLRLTSQRPRGAWGLGKSRGVVDISGHLSVSPENAVAEKPEDSLAHREMNSLLDSSL
jgi:hypothetical protein